MAPSLYPHTPYCLNRSNGGAHLALASVGALPANDPNVQAWNPFARNSTPYRNIVLVGQDADSELRYLANNGSIDFNPYGFATVGTVLDCQRLYDMLHPGLRDNMSLIKLIRYCYPEANMDELCLHNAGNDAVWELKVCMKLLAKLAERYAPESADYPAFPKVWDAIFVAVDVESLNGDPDRITELGYACLDSRDMVNIHDDAYERKITARHLIIKKNVPVKVNGVRDWGRTHRFGNANYDTDNFDPHYGPSKEIWPWQIPPNANKLFFVPKNGKQWGWTAPAGLRPQDGGDCSIQTSSRYWDKLMRKPFNN
ncbi:MAG: hypothetical protein Q9168_006611 [Polycauliona sp. 1 TL-2023]